MKSRIILFGCLAVIALALGACASSKPEPRGPVYYVTEGVTKVIYDKEQGQIACERDEELGSHVKASYCYTAAEIIQRHNADARNLKRWDRNQCPEPSLCKK